MVKIDSIQIFNFRGIKQLVLELKCKNFAIMGRNGSGKSGVVDAIEFVFMGVVSRLRGEGCGTLSQKEHIPHVDVKGNPKKSLVRVKLVLERLQKEVLIERNVANPAFVRITPDDQSIQDELREVIGHPELVLSRREILRYVLSEPGKRSKEIQALLKLDEIEKARSSLKTGLNSAARELKTSELAFQNGKVTLLQALNIPQLKKDLVLAAVNEKRKALGIDEIRNFTQETSFKEGVVGAKTSHVLSSINKDEALKTIAGLKTVSAKLPEGCAKAIERLIAIIASFEADMNLFANLKKNQFFTTGLSLLDNSECPFCGDEWDLEELRQVIKKKLENAQEAFRLKKEFEKNAEPLRVVLREICRNIREACALEKQLKLQIKDFEWVAWEKTLNQLDSELGDFKELDKLKNILAGDLYLTPTTFNDNVKKLEDAINKIPSVSDQDKAKEYLILCDERLIALRKNKANYDVCLRRQSQLDKAIKYYEEASEAVLGQVYSEVETDFSKYYQTINADDESTFRAKFIPHQGALDFSVDFYGRGLYPPSAYHSEGHQDSMGVCLYLALMKKILGTKFSFAVLDDVLMSVDAGHRKEVSNLLKAEFKNTQFVITTHDQVWFQHMISQGLISRAAGIHFRKWTVDDGPMIWEEKEIWQEIEDELAKSDVPKASAALRRYLEFLALELSRKLRAKAEIGAVENYELGDLLPAVVHRYKELMNKGKDSAQSWDQKQLIADLVQREKQFGEKVNKTNVEQWAINKTVHYNEWANLDINDFKPVVASFRELVEALKCVKCNGWFYATPPKGKIDGLRCECGDTNINLQKKSSATCLVG